MRKVRLLLAAGTPARYVAVDISGEQLLLQGVALARDFPHLLVEAVHADFANFNPAISPCPRKDGGCSFCLGRRSAISSRVTPKRSCAKSRGCWTRKARRSWVWICARSARFWSALTTTRAGYTARFNLNLLVRINRELGADFALDRFEHVAFYNSTASRIEMHLRSRCQQSVRIAGRRFTLAAGETIHTENSYKYLPEGFSAMAARAGFDRLACGPTQRSSSACSCSRCQMSDSSSQLSDVRLQSHRCDRPAPFLC